MNETYTTLISVQQLKSLRASGQPLMVFDCSFDLTNPQAGKAMHLQSHIPGAVYAHLDAALGDKSGQAGGAAGASNIRTRPVDAQSIRRW